MAVAVESPLLAGANRPESALEVGRLMLTEAVEETLGSFLAVEVGALEEADRELGRFARTARDFVLAGGKRLRPTFAHWGWRGLVGSTAPSAPVLPALGALELLHTFALVHDDVMDGSATRRGRPSAHRAMAAQHVEAHRTGDPDRFGISAAILIGDLCLVWADRLLATASLPTRTVLAARRCYDQMRIEAIAGQYLDVLGESEFRNWSLERTLRVARNKTASYTVTRPLLFGAALAGRWDDAPVTAGYTAYGTAIGEAFQLLDDVLGVYGDPAITGKPVGDDLRSGKPTVLVMTAQRLATPAQRAELRRALAAAAGTDDVDVETVAELIAATGAVDEIGKMIEARVLAGLTALHEAPIDSAARDALAQLAVTVTQRRA